MSTLALLQNDIPTNLFSCDFGKVNQYNILKKEERMKKKKEMFFLPLSFPVRLLTGCLIYIEEYKDVNMPT